MGNHLLSTRLSSKLHRVLVGLLTLAVVLVALLVFAYTAVPTGAASWTVRSQGNCGPQGDSWLNWDGYGSSAQGWTEGKLWRWNSGSSTWVVKAQGGATYTGSVGNALVHLTATYESGLWTQTGVHWSNFFSGNKTSASANWTCP